MYTHTPECRRGAFVFFLIFSDSVEQRTLVCAGCASCTFSFLSFFFDELFNSTKF